jgi:uncharacterized C2H2 Zn-finger protein
MEAVATIGVHSPSTFYISPQDVLDSPQNIYEAKTDKKLPINTSSNYNKGKGISQFKCVKCGCSFSSKNNVVRHLRAIHEQTGSSFENDIVRICDIKPELKPNCPKCNAFLKTSNSLRVHLNQSHMMNSSFKGEILQYTTDCTGKIQMYSVVINSDECSYLPTRSCPNLVTFKKHEKKYNKVSPHTRNDNGQTINIKERVLKTQDNTNANKTTTDNMDSNRKRSHSPAIHKEESNAKKAMLNPSESGYLQSSDTLSSISNDRVEGSDFGDRFLKSITADDSFATQLQVTSIQ